MYMFVKYFVLKMFENRNRWQVKIEQKWSNLIKIVEVDQNCLNSNFLITICEKTKIKNAGMGHLKRTIMSMRCR